MKFLSMLKKLSDNIRYYDKISPTPYSRNSHYNPFAPKKAVMMVWIEKR